MDSFEAFKDQWSFFMPGALSAEQLETCRTQYQQYIHGVLDPLHFEPLDTTRAAAQLEQVLQRTYHDAAITTPRFYIFAYPAPHATDARRWALFLEPTADGYALQYDWFETPATPGTPPVQHTHCGFLGAAAGTALDAMITAQMQDTRPASGKWVTLEGVTYYLFKQLEAQWQAVRKTPMDDSTPPGKLVAVLESIAAQLPGIIQEAALLAEVAQLHALVETARLEEAEGLRRLREM